MTNWIATAGIDWDDAGKERRIEAGQPVPDRLVRVAPWLADQGHVVEGGTGVPDLAPDPEPEPATPSPVEEVTSG
jgi:hypothetical protein